MVAAMGAAARKLRGELVVSGGDASPVLEPAPETLDEIARLVGVAIVGDGSAPAGCGGNDHLGALRGDGGADGVGVVAAIGDEPVETAGGRLDQACRHGHVVDVPAESMSRRRRPWASSSPWSLLV